MKRVEIGEIVGVHRNTVGEWIKLWKNNGVSALKVKAGGASDRQWKKILEACKVAGLELSRTYGPVYKHMLFNLPKDKYSVPFKCPVSEYAGTERAATLSYAYLGNNESTIKRIADIIREVALNYQSLK